MTKPSTIHIPVLAVPPLKGVAHLPAGVVSLWSSSQQLACCNLVLLLSLEVLL